MIRHDEGQLLKLLIGLSGSRHPDELVNKFRLTVWLLGLRPVPMHSISYIRCSVLSCPLGVSERSRSHQIQVNVFASQAVQALLESFGHAPMVFIIQLGDEEDLGARNARFTNGFSDVLFVAIARCLFTGMVKKARVPSQATCAPCQCAYNQV